MRRSEFFGTMLAGVAGMFHEPPVPPEPPEFAVEPEQEPGPGPPDITIRLEGGFDVLNPKFIRAVQEAGRFHGMGP